MRWLSSCLPERACKMAAREAALISELLEGDIVVDALKHKLLSST